MSGNSFHTSGSSPTVPCKVGLLGFGTVGSAIARRLAEPAGAASHLALGHVFDRRASLKRERFAGTAPSAAPIRWTTHVDEILTSDADIIVEAIGGTGEALDWTRAALRAGKSVVTCNKQLIARHGPDLLDLAARQGRQLRFEAAVGGAMPIVRALADGLAGERITRVVGILNGTANAVLSGMEARGETMEQALADARARGYAEADPSADLDGLDAGAKLAILCSLAFGLRVEPEQIEAQTITGLTASDFREAARRGGTIRQLAWAAYDASRSELIAWVAPRPVRRSSLFGRTNGPWNAAIISGAFAGDVSLSGAGAGGDATAVAVLSDMIAIARDRAAIVPAPRLSRPGSIIGLTDKAENGREARQAEPADGAEDGVLCDLRELCA